MELPQEDSAITCADCAGSGKVTRLCKVAHLLGTDEMSFNEDCDSCEGTGDATKELTNA